MGCIQSPSPPCSHRCRPSPEDAPPPLCGPHGTRRTIHFLFWPSRCRFYFRRRTPHGRPRWPPPRPAAALRAAAPRGRDAWHGVCGVCRHMSNDALTSGVVDTQSRSSRRHTVAGISYFCGRGAHKKHRGACAFCSSSSASCWSWVAVRAGSWVARGRGSRGAECWFDQSVRGGKCPRVKRNGSKIWVPGL